MTVDFYAALKRHYEDARFLEESGRKPNSGQLFGIAAECGLKALLIDLGHRKEANGDLDKNEGFRKHINQITKAITTLETWLQGRSATKYYTMLNKLTDFNDWDVSHRYFAESAIPDSLEKWKAAVEDIRRAVEQIRVERGNP